MYFLITAGDNQSNKKCLIFITEPLLLLKFSESFNIFLISTCSDVYIYIEMF